MTRKLMQPRPGDRVQLRYARARREWIGLHEVCGTVVVAMKGRRVAKIKAPSNYAVVIDGEVAPTIVPWGQIYAED